MVKTFYTRYNRIDIITADNSGVFEGFGRIFYVLCAENVLMKPLDNAVLVMVYPYEWNYMMTPIRAKAKQYGNTGGGEEYAAAFAMDVMKTVEDYLAFIPDERIIAGYSLGGIEAHCIYKAYPKGTFGGVASVSGSFWYENIAGIYKEAAADYAGVQVYFSLGDKEARSKTHADVEKNTIELCKAFSGYTNTVFKREEGGHFNDISGRIERMISWFDDV